MEFNGLVESSYQKAKSLLPFMAKKRIPLTPANYRLFYDYFEGQSPQLKSRLDQLLGEGVLFTPELSDRLYHEIYDYSEDLASNLKEASQKFETVSIDLGKGLDKTLITTGHYRQFLSESVAQISSSAELSPSLQGILNSLLEETESAFNDQAHLADQIENTNKIIATLTSELRDQTRLANIDELTKLYNRRYFFHRFQQMKEAAKGDPAICLAIFDLDNFKSINDTYGHAIGDKVIILCSKILQSYQADDCLPVRYGGEEFILLCEGKGLPEMKKIAEGVRKKVERTEVMVRGKYVPVTISSGVSKYRPGEDITVFIERADQALYRAKSHGRNMVLLEGEGLDCCPTNTGAQGS
jgi:diguanylate cyclase